MALQQSLQQKLLQKLSPQQIQLMKLLQIPTAQLEERIKAEIEENPALEQVEDAYEETADVADDFSEDFDDEFKTEGSAEEYDDVDVSDYVYENEDEVGEYKLKDEHFPEISDNTVLPQKIEVGFNELMLQQLGLLHLDKTERKIAEQIIGSLDDDGYLRREVSSIIDDLAFRQNIDATEKQVITLLLQIQQFDPAGVAARNLQECLSIQLKRKLNQGAEVASALKVVEQYFEEFIKKHYEKIKKGLDVSEEELKTIINQIIKLNPKPGLLSSEANSGENYIIPDFFITNNNGHLELTLNSKNAPELRISGDYREMLQEYEKGSKKDRRQKEAIVFIKQKLDAAKWFIDAIKQRQSTLMNTMEAIMNYQYQFLLTGDETELKPMILKDIAEKTDLDISTISRVANSKFVETEFGTFKLKFFFSESLQTESGEEVSTREVKMILNEIIGGESKKNPLSDEQLTELLQEKGYNIARRTVAKYREQLNIPVARLRKKL